MLRDPSGKPTALGEFDMATAQWVQIRENSNGMPTDATRAAFTGYTATIQAWRALSIQSGNYEEEDDDDDFDDDFDDEDEDEDEEEEEEEEEEDDEDDDDDEDEDEDD
jgi:hypothetical protein